MAAVARIRCNAPLDERILTMKITVAKISTPIGELRAATTPAGICAVNFTDRWDAVWKKLEIRFGPLEETSQGETFGLMDRLKEYFAGKPDDFNGLPFDPGGTQFQQIVWKALREIKRGETWSYGGVAAYIGNPKAVRAVGSSNGRNPLSIVVPCHRVIGSDGALRGYGCGVHRKEWLLALERS